MGNKEVKGEGDDHQLSEVSFLPFVSTPKIE